MPALLRCRWLPSKHRGPKRHAASIFGSSPSGALRWLYGPSLPHDVPRVPLAPLPSSIERPGSRTSLSRLRRSFPSSLAWRVSRRGYGRAMPEGSGAKGARETCKARVVPCWREAALKARGGGGTSRAKLGTCQVPGPLSQEQRGGGGSGRDRRREFPRELNLGHKYGQVEERTTLMIRNVPNQYTQVRSTRFMENGRLNVSRKNSSCLDASELRF